MKLAAIALLLGLAAGCAPANRAAPPAPSAAAFTLTDQNGKRYSVATANAPPTALYFGFTHCKDICTATLAMLSRARAKAGLSPAALRIAMVTVDPAHDTPAVLKAYLSKIRIAASGLTGNSTQLHHVYRSYGVVIEPQKGTLGHTDYVYLIDAHGKLRRVVAPDAQLNDVASALRKLVD